MDSRVHNSWLSVHVAQVTWIIYGNCFVSKLILLTNPILQSVRTIWLWCCALLSTYAWNLKLVLQWQERPLPARLPSLPRPPFSCTRSALTFPTSYSVFFFLFFYTLPAILSSILSFKMSKHFKHYSLGAIVQIIKEKKERR